MRAMTLMTVVCGGSLDGGPSDARATLRILHPTSPYALTSLSQRTARRATAWAVTPSRVCVGTTAPPEPASRRRIEGSDVVSRVRNIAAGGASWRCVLPVLLQSYCGEIGR